MNPWQQFLQNIANLFKVKTIITLIIVFTFCFLTIGGTFDGKDFLIIATAVITYYFTKDTANKDTPGKETTGKENTGKEPTGKGKGD